MLKLFKKYHFLIFLFIITIIFNRWFYSYGTLTSGDFLPRDQAMLNNIFDSKQSWEALYNLGRVNLVLSYNFLHFVEQVLGRLGISFGVVERIIYIWPMIIVLAISGYRLNYYVFKSWIAGYTGSIIFVLNTFVLSYSHILVHVLVAFGFITLALVEFLKLLDKPKLKLLDINYILLLVFSFFISIYDFRMIIIFVYILIIVLCFYLFHSYKEKNTKLLLKKIAIYGSLYTLFLILINLHWILPTMSSGQLTENSILDRALFGSDLYTLENAYKFFFFSWNNGDRPVALNLQSPSLYFWLIPFSAFLGILTNLKNMKVVLFSILLLSGFVLNKQSAEPFGELYSFLYYNLPTFNLFRESSKFLIFSFLGFSVLIGALVNYLSYNKKDLKIITIRFQQKWITIVASILLIMATLSPFLINAQYIFTGSLKNLFIEKEIDSDIEKYNNFVQEQDQNFRTLNIPTLSDWVSASYENPSINFDEMVSGDWAKFTKLREENHYNNLLKLKDLLDQDYFKYVLKYSGIKYLVTMPSDFKNDPHESGVDLYYYYGGERDSNIIKSFNSLLDEYDFLEKKEIGTHELTVYENTLFNGNIHKTDATPVAISNSSNWDKKSLDWNEDDIITIDNNSYDIIYVSDLLRVNSDENYNNNIFHDENGFYFEYFNQKETINSSQLNYDISDFKNNKCLKSAIYDPSLEFSSDDSLKFITKVNKVCSEIYVESIDQGELLIFFEADTNANSYGFNIRLDNIDNDYYNFEMTKDTQLGVFRVPLSSNNKGFWIEFYVDPNGEREAYSGYEETYLTVSNLDLQTIDPIINNQIIGYDDQSPLNDQYQVSINTISATTKEINIKEAQDRIGFQIAEGYNSHWEIFDKGGKKIDSNIYTHKQTYLDTNYYEFDTQEFCSVAACDQDNGLKNIQLFIKYTPQSQLNTGLVISAATMLITLIIFVYTVYYEKNK